MKNFALIGASGYIAPRHLKAIKETGNNLDCALDLNDSVGIIDSFFPSASFFVETERFDRYIEKLKFSNDKKIDYVSICSPNYLHDAHIRMALRWGCDAICEKPLVLNPWNIDALSKIEIDYGKRIWNILQLREHPSIIELKRKVEKSPAKKVFDIDLTYITSRGKWYHTSWKGDKNKSGGISTNIGVHFYDMLSYVFGKVKINRVHLHTHDRSAGYLEFEKARVRWFLSINYDLIPKNVKESGLRTFRSIKIENEELEFSGGFENLHTKLYENILNGKGYGIEECRQAIEIVYKIRNEKTTGIKGDYHPLANSKLSDHPFK